MPREIPYIDTTVAVEKTLAEIEELLQVHNATRIVKDYDMGRIKAIGFWHGGVPFQLPAKSDSVYQYLYNKHVDGARWLQKGRWTYGSPSQAAKASWDAQADRCAWRNVTAWVKAQLALVEIGMVSVTEVFLPYMLVGSQETLYNRMLQEGLHGVKALGPGGVTVEKP